MKEIKVTIASRTTLEIKEPAEVGDIIDLTKINNTLDQSSIDQIFNNIKDQKINELVKQRVIDATAQFERTKANEIKLAEANLTNALRDKYERELSELREKKAKLEADANAKEQVNQGNLKAALNEKEYEYKKLVDNLKEEIGKKESEIEDLTSNTRRWKNFQNWDRFPDGGLENYCHDFYLNHMKKYWPNIEFIKDTELVSDDEEDKSKTKGDFILRETSEDGFDFSVSFEMKNEKFNNVKGKKIKDHYAQANINRNKKKCKYAVIITTLEHDINFNVREVNEYPHMWIARPEFFEDIITQLRDKEWSIFDKTKELQNQIMISRRENIDLENFEDKINNFKEKFTKHCASSKDKFDTAIEEIDKTIEHLTKVKNALIGSSTHMLKANDDLDSITIKKLSHGNPTIANLLKGKKK